MQSSTSTSIHETHTNLFNTVHRRPSSYSADLQDSSPIGRPLTFIPKRKSNCGRPTRQTFNEDSNACPSPQQRQIRLIEETASDDSATPQTTPRSFCTFPRIKPELSRGRAAQHDTKLETSPQSDDPPTEKDITGASAPSSLDQPDAPLPLLNIVRTPNLSDPPSPPFPERSSSTFLLRKKSGELVKPSLKSAGFASWAASSAGRARTKSAPTTPMGSKSVHFDAQLEHVKLFLAEQKPLAVSRDGSPTETSEGDTTDSGFPFPRTSGTTLRLKSIALPQPPPDPWTFDVRLERCCLEDTVLVGQVLVRNIAFTKWVAIRFTLDDWQTTSEVTARHLASIRDHTFDRFEFRVRLVDYMKGIESKKLIFCVRFSVEGQQMWDSNGGKNYEVGFEKVREDPSRQMHPPSLSGSKTSPALVTDLRKELEKVVQTVPSSGTLSPAASPNRKKPHGLRVWLGDIPFGRNDDDNDDDDPTPPFRPRSRSPSPLDDQKQTSATPSLSNTNVPLSARYDFGASLRRPNWTPPQVQTMLPTPGSTTTSRSKTTHRRPRSPPPPTPNLTSPIQTSRTGYHRRSLTVPFDTNPTNVPPERGTQGSPRDSARSTVEGVEEHRHSQGDDVYDEDRPRRHARGWVRSSSFEQIAADDKSPLKKTPPGMPTVTPPTPPIQGPEFHLNCEETSSSSSCSPSVSPSTSLEPLDTVWDAVRRKEDEHCTSASSVSTSSSTPPIESPLSPLGELPRCASHDSLMGALTPKNSSQRPPINSTPYYSLLDQFCFFTGVNNYYSNHTSDIPSPHRVQLASTVEDYFSQTPPHHDDDQSPLSNASVSPNHILPPITPDFASSHELVTSS